MTLVHLKRTTFVALASVLAVLIVGCPPASDEQEASAPAVEEAALGATFTVRVLTAGLVALVPSTSGHSLGLLMIDARTPIAASNGCKMAEHTPMLTWSAGSCMDGNTACEAEGIAVLDAEDLQFRFAGNGPVAAHPPLELGALADPAARPSVEYPSTSTAQSGPLGPEWTIHLGELYPAATTNAVALNPGCLSASPEEGCPVVARMRLDFGTVQTCRLAEITTEEAPNVAAPWTFDFQALGGMHQASSFVPRALAMVAEVVWQVEGNRLDLVRRPFNGTQPSTTLSLTPNGDGEIVLSYLNMPPEEWKPDAGPDCDAQKVDYHFEHYYRIAQSNPAVMYVPHAVERIAAQIQPRCTVPSGLLHSQHSSRRSKSEGGPVELDIPAGTAACVKMVYPSAEGIEGLPAVELGGNG